MEELPPVPATGGTLSRIGAAAAGLRATRDRARISSRSASTQDRRSARLSEACIELQIVLRHAVRGEAALEFTADAGSVERAYPPHGLDRLILAVHDEAGHCVFQHLRDRAILERDDGSSAGHRLDHHQSEGLAPRDREDEPGGIAQEFLLLVLADLADELDVALPEQRLDRGC